MIFLLQLLPPSTLLKPGHELFDRAHEQKSLETENPKDKSGLESKIDGQVTIPRLKSR